jgi:hypothetical protein
MRACVWCGRPIQDVDVQAGDARRAQHVDRGLGGFVALRSGRWCPGSRVEILHADRGAGHAGAASASIRRLVDLVRVDLDRELRILGSGAWRESPASDRRSFPGSSSVGVPPPQCRRAISTPAGRTSAGQRDLGLERLDIGRDRRRGRVPCVRQAQNQQSLRQKGT